MQVYMYIRIFERKPFRMEITPLHQEVTNLHAEVCSALADPNRILILYALSEKPYTVSDLTTALGLPQPTTSRHLKVLRDRNLVKATRQGMNVEYSLDDLRLIEALDLLRGVMRDRITHRASLVEEYVESKQA
ncbi:MAG: winged helix-turn-helix transcriptional regulator [Chloroflexi bacterium]|nr:winged helix-turn-helix transcriptional regulator [Chloroflexota bacterium]